jgi:hypothetical protein
VVGEKNETSQSDLTGQSGMCHHNSGGRSR